MPYFEDQHASKTADMAVKKVFAILGVDIEDPASVENFRQDLRFSGALRKLANKGAAGVIGLIVLGIGTALWAGIMALIKRG